MKFSLLLKAAQASLNHPGQAPPLPKKEKPGMSHLFLCRHCQTFDNARRIFSGRRQSHLTPQGQRQAAILAKKLKQKHLDLIISAPLSRCRETLKQIRKDHPQTPIRLEPLLLERDYGQLTGKSKLKLMQENPKMAVLYRRSYDTPPPGGESLKDVRQQRIYPFYRQLLQLLNKKPTNILVCCTNNTMRLLRMFFEHLTIEQMLTLENPFADYAVYSIPLKKK